MSTTTPQPTPTQKIKNTRWRIDPTRSQIEFHTPTLWGLMTVKGRFEHYHGTLDLRHDPAIALTIDAASLTTHNKIRDKHLRSSDFFDVANHPHVRFVSDSAKLHGERLTVSGHLHTAGKRTPLDLDATLRQIDGELEIDTSASADQFELGMSHGTLGMIRTPSQLSVRGRLVRAAD